MSEKAVPVSVHILDKEYLIACQPEEKETLLESSHHLDTKMREIRDSGKIIGTDRIAVMAALNIAHELLDQQASSKSGGIATSRRILKLQDKIDIALSTNKQLEF
ncbi:MAG: cell division protein ZapA [Gammaproteobacteria bacterium]|nr:cell division protein ZapA [Gammaproteobacteria bacterium]